MRGVVALLLLLLLVPTSAGSFDRGALEGIAARDATLTGEGVVVKVVETHGAYSPNLSLAAERINVTVYRSDDEFNPPNGGGTITQRLDRMEAVWHDAQVSVTEARPNVVLFLDSESPVRVEDSRMSVSGHFKNVVSETSTTPGEPPLRQASVTTLHDVGTTAATVTLTGNFTLSIWDWDIHIQNRTDSQDHWSGSRNRTGLLSPAINGQENQRIYLNATNGRLDLSLEGLTVLDLYIAGTRLEAVSAVLDLAGQDAPLSLAGPLRFDLDPVRNGVFPGRVLGPEQAVGETTATPVEPGTPLAPATIATDEESLWTTSLLVGLLIVAAAALLVWRALRLLRLRRALDEGDYRSVAAGAGLENSRRFGPEVVVARVVCMVKTGEYAAAASLLEKRGDRLSPAVCAYLWACVHAGSGATEEARDAVIRSVLADPGMAMEVAANGSLRRFLADVGEGGYS